MFTQVNNLFFLSSQDFSQSFPVYNKVSRQMIPRKLIFEQFKRLFYNVWSLAQLGTQKHSLPTTQQCQLDAFMYSVAFVGIVILSNSNPSFIYSYFIKLIFILQSIFCPWKCIKNNFISRILLAKLKKCYVTALTVETVQTVKFMFSNIGLWSNCT